MLFFCYGDGDHRDLPSFPTRRSSDLEPHPPAHPYLFSWFCCGCCDCCNTLLAPTSWKLFKSVQNVPGPAKMSRRDRKSTRLNSSHANISYAVFCLKKKNIHLALSSSR